MSRRLAISLYGFAVVGWAFSIVLIFHINNLKCDHAAAIEHHKNFVTETRWDVAMTELSTRVTQLERDLHRVVQDGKQP